MHLWILQIIFFFFLVVSENLWTQNSGKKKRKFFGKLCRRFFGFFICLKFQTLTADFVSFICLNFWTKFSGKIKSLKNPVQQQEFVHFLCNLRSFLLQFCLGLLHLQITQTHTEGAWVLSSHFFSNLLCSIHAICWFWLQLNQILTVALNCFFTLDEHNHIFTAAQLLLILWLNFICLVFFSFAENFGGFHYHFVILPAALLVVSPFRNFGFWIWSNIQQQQWSRTKSWWLWHSCCNCCLISLRKKEIKISPFCKNWCEIGSKICLILITINFSSRIFSILRKGCYQLLEGKIVYKKRGKSVMSLLCGVYNVNPLMYFINLNIEPSYLMMQFLNSNGWLL